MMAEVPFHEYKVAHRSMKVSSSGGLGLNDTLSDVGFVAVLYIKVLRSPLMNFLLGHHYCISDSLVQIYFEC